MAKHIGIVACSAEGAALCYRTICLEGAKVMENHAHPEISMHTYPLSDYTPYFDIGDWDSVAKLMISSCEKVAQVGAEFAICPDNTIHQPFKQVRELSPIPWLHIAEVVASQAKNQGRSRLAILGTQYLMEGPVYPEKLTESNIDYRIPDSSERKRINAIMFDELVYGKFLNESRDYFIRVISRLGTEEGCDAVVLGCTEIPLLITPDISPLPTLDSTRLLAGAALNEAVSQDS